MGENIRNGKGKQAHGSLGHIARALKQSQFFELRTAGWQPAVNAYRCEGCIRVCVDLAGVEQSVIEIHAKPRSLLIRGHRSSPEPQARGPKTARVLALEIDHGPFEREIFLEAEVEPSAVSAEQSNGLLWISVPLRAHG